MEKSEESHLKIVILGSEKVGKTSIMNQYVSHTFSEQYRATIGADFAIKDLFLDDGAYRLQIWDTAGNERFQALSRSFYRGASAGILVFDLTNQDSFNSLKDIYQTFIDTFEGETSLPYVVVVGSKLDKIESGECQRAVDFSLVSEFCMERQHIPYYETSALSNTNLDLIFEAVVKKLPGNWALNVKAAKKLES